MEYLCKNCVLFDGYSLGTFDNFSSVFQYWFATHPVLPVNQTVCFLKKLAALVETVETIGQVHKAKKIKQKS